MDNNSLHLSDDSWDISPPNTPLKMEWPALESKSSKPESTSKDTKPFKSNWKKHRKNELLSALREEASANASSPQLEASMILTNEEQSQMMQLLSIFDDIEVGVVVSILRGANGDVEMAIDRLLVISSEMERQNEAMKNTEESERTSQEENGVRVTLAQKLEEEALSFCDEESDSSELNDFEELVEEVQESFNELEDDWSQGSLKASYESEDGRKSVGSINEECDQPSLGDSAFEKYRILGEYIELPAVPQQDSDVERWLQEFDISSKGFRRSPSADSTAEVAGPLSDSTLVHSIGTVDSLPLLGDSGFQVKLPLLESSIPELIEFGASSPNISHLEDSGLDLGPRIPSVPLAYPDTSAELKPFSLTRTISEPIKVPVKEYRPYFFALDDEKLELKSNKESAQKKSERRHNAMLRRQEKKLSRQRAKLSRRLPSVVGKEVGTITVNQQVVSIGVDPKETEVVSLVVHQEKIAELERAKKQVEDEKKTAMSWCVEQMVQIRNQNEEKNVLIEKQNSKIEEQQLEIEALNRKLREMKAQENKLQNLVLSSKDMIVEGVQVLQKNILEGLSVVEKDWVILEKMKEFDLIEKVKDLDLLEKMKNLANSLKDEISSTFSKLEASMHGGEAREDMSFQEERQLWIVEKASLESYITELKIRIKELEGHQS